jgi:myo-inositol-1(or 4)-monophosphatase
MHPMLNTAVKAARRAGNTILRYARDLDRLTVESKADHQGYVTEVDKASEQAILDILQESYPDHHFLCEESGLTTPSAQSDFQWIIDPLDGTTNFIHGLPHYCISIALMARGVLQQAVVFQPETNLLFTATRGAGAYLNDRRIRVSKRAHLRDSLFVTGYAYHPKRPTAFYRSLQQGLAEASSGLRNSGSSALDLAYCATGWYDGTIQLGARSWDVAAGALLIQESGGMISDFNGGADFIDKGHLIASTPKIFPALSQLVQEHLNTLPEPAQALASLA